MFQNPGPEQDPCGVPFVMFLSMVKFCVFTTTFLLLKNALLRLYRFLGQLKSLSPCKITGHDAESKAFCTSKLAIITSPLFSMMGCANAFTSIAASIVFL